MTQAHSVILKIDGLTKLHGQFKALNSISFSINRGEILVFLGPMAQANPLSFPFLPAAVNPIMAQPALMGCKSSQTI